MLWLGPISLIKLARVRAQEFAERRRSRKNTDRVKSAYVPDNPGMVVARSQ